MECIKKTEYTVYRSKKRSIRIKSSLSSSELNSKFQVSFPNLLVCYLFPVVDFFSKTTKPNFTKLGAKHPYGKGISNG